MKIEVEYNFFVVLKMRRSEKIREKKNIFSHFYKQLENHIFEDQKFFLFYLRQREREYVKLRAKNEEENSNLYLES